MLHSYQTKAGELRPSGWNLLHNEEFFGAENVEVVQEATFRPFRPAKIRMDFRGFREGFKSCETVEISSDMEPSEIFKAIIAAKNEGEDMSWVDEIE